MIYQAKINMIICKKNINWKHYFLVVIYNISFTIFPIIPHELLKLKIKKAGHISANKDVGELELSYAVVGNVKMVQPLVWYCFTPIT